MKEDIIQSGKEISIIASALITLPEHMLDGMNYWVNEIIDENGKKVSVVLVELGKNRVKAYGMVEYVSLILPTQEQADGAFNALYAMSMAAKNQLKDDWPDTASERLS